MGIQVKLPDAREMIEQCLKAKVVPYLQGSPGCGKSALIQQIADAYNLLLIDIRLAQCDPTDLMGFPDVDRERGKAGYLPMDTFPIEGDELPVNPKTGQAYTGWLLFFDELPLAPESVQKAAYKILLDHEVGEHKLHERVAKVCAGNLVADNAMVEDLTTALQSRLIHMEMEVDVKAWLEWARENGIDHRITSYINWKPDLLFKFNPDHDDKTFACPRTWDFASRLIKAKAMLEPLDKILLAGTISEGVAREFYGYCQFADRLPSIAEICKNPTTVRVSDEPSIAWMLTGALGEHANADNIGSLMEYVSRMPREFQVITLKEITKRTPRLMQSPAVDRWVTVNGHTLY